MTHPLGALIHDEVTRAEKDYETHRVRAQALLTVSGLLVTTLAGLLAIAVGKDSSLELSRLTTAAAAGTLVCFVCANLMVLVIFRPSDVDFPTPSELGDLADTDWDPVAGWDREVAIVLVKYLKSLRKANDTLAKRLAAAIRFQVLGVLGATLMVLSLLDSVSRNT